jgi:hypothetical protein
MALTCLYDKLGVERQNKGVEGGVVAGVVTRERTQAPNES